MFRRLHVIRRGPVALAAGLLLAAVVPSAIAAWQIPATGQGSAVASPDFHAPSVTSSTVAPVGMTAVGGSVKAGTQYIVYAQVTDPGTGVASVHANISSLTAGAASVSLTPCVASCTIGVKTYAYSSAPVTADAGLAQGTKNYSVWAADNVGNTSSPISYSATVDNTAPTVTAGAIAASPSNGAGWLHQGGSYIVYANAADAGGAVATVTADVNSVTPGTTALSLPKCTTSCTVGGVTYGFKSAVTAATTPLAAGNANFSVTVTDAAASTATGSYHATVDNTAPTQSAAVVAASTTSAAGFVKSAGSYVAYANATDAGSGISSVVTDVSGLTSGQTALAMTACTSSCTVGGITYGYKSASKTVGTLPEGPVAFTVTATDLASNSTAGHYSATVDNTGPVVTGSAIANTTTSATLIRKSGAYLVYANATDAASGVATVKANVSTITSGQSALALSVCTTSCTVGGVTYGYKSASKNAANTLPAGPVSYSVTATDGVGNASTATGSVTADNTAPTVSAAAVATVATNVPGFIRQGAELHRLRGRRRCVGRLHGHYQGEHADHGSDRPRDAGLRRHLQRWRRQPRFRQRRAGRQRRALGRQQELHADRHRHGRQHDHHIQLHGDRRQHRADGGDHVPAVHVHQRMDGRMRHRIHRRHLWHRHRRHRRHRHGAVQLAPVGRAQPLLEPRHQLVLVGRRGADSGHPGAAQLVGAGRRIDVHEYDGLHHPGGFDR